MIFNLILVLSFLLPFQVAINPSEGVDMASVRIFILVLFFFWLAEGLRKKNIRIVRNRTAAAAVIFLFLVIVSSLAAKNFDWSLRKILFMLTAFPLYFVLAGLRLGKEKELRIIKALVSGATIAALFGIFQFGLQFVFGFEKVVRVWADVVAPPFLGANVTEAVIRNSSWLVNIAGETVLRATSLFPDPHMLSFFLGLLVMPAIGLFIVTRRKIFFVSFLIILVADFLTFSRGGYLGLIAGSIFLMFSFGSQMSKRSKWAAAIFMVLVLSVFYFPSPVSDRFISGFDPKEGSNQGRIEMWVRAWEISAEHPLTGVGIGNFPLEIKASADYRDPIYAHNAYLDIASEVGLIGAFAWITMIWSAGTDFMKKRKENGIFIFMAGSLVVFAAHSLVETPIFSPVNLTLFLIIISLSTISRKNEALNA